MFLSVSLDFPLDFSSNYSLSKVFYYFYLKPITDMCIRVYVSPISDENYYIYVYRFFINLYIYIYARIYVCQRVLRVAVFLVATL